MGSAKYRRFHFGLRRAFRILWLLGFGLGQILGSPGCPSAPFHVQQPVVVNSPISDFSESFNYLYTNQHLILFPGSFLTIYGVQEEYGYYQDT